MAAGGSRCVLTQVNRLRTLVSITTPTEGQAPKMTNPVWWEAAVAGRCRHGGHGWDGSQCRQVPVIDRAIAHARREAWRAASGMTTAELRAGVREYRMTVGLPTGEALTQLRMVRTVIAQRVRSTRSRSRAAAQTRQARARNAGAR
jgi:hypothetical protein